MFSFGNTLRRLEVPHDGGTVPNRWINNDIKPIETGRRTWGYWMFNSLWILINTNISTYLSGSALIAFGLTWWHAVIAIVVGNLLATIFIILNSLPGAYYYIGFPVANRYVWGMRGSLFPLLNRILLSLVWSGFQAWIGGQCVYVMLYSIWPSIEERIPNHLDPSTGTTPAYFVSYVIFMVLSLPMIHIRPQNLQWLFYVSSAVVMLFFLILLIWSLSTMGDSGFGGTLSSTTPTGSGSVGWSTMFGINATIGAIAAGILSQNDYARYARRPRHAIAGQAFNFPFYSISCSMIGILVIAATQDRFGEALWNPPDLLIAIVDSGGSRSRAAAFFAGASLVISQIGIFVPGNTLAGGFDFAAIFPKYLNIRRGAYLTFILSVVVNPWRLVNTATIFLAVISGYSVFLGPMTGLMITSFFIVNKQKIKLEDLFQGTNDSIYWYTMGVDWRAPVAWICGTVPSLPVFISSVSLDDVVTEGSTRLYNLGFLVGFAISSIVFITLHVIFPEANPQAFVRTTAPAGELITIYREKVDLGTAFYERNSSKGST